MSLARERHHGIVRRVWFEIWINQFENSIQQYTIFFDARKYCYANGDAIAEGAETVTKIKHEMAKFEYTIDVGNVTKSGIYLVGEFIGMMSSWLVPELEEYVPTMVDPK